MSTIIEIGLAVGALTLQTLDGHELIMQNYASRLGTAVVFLSSRAPATQAAAGIISDMAEKYRRKGVLFVGVFSNAGETRDEIRAFCQGRSLIFPVYRDVEGRAAKRLGARVTPEVFLIDKEGVLVYRGGFGDAKAVQEIENRVMQMSKDQDVQRGESPATGTPIGETGSMGETAPPGEPVAFSSEVIFEKQPWAPDHHCSTIAEAFNGDLLCVWFGGSFESGDDQALFIARRTKGGRMWSAPDRFVTGQPFHPPGNAVVFRVSANRIGILYDRMDEERPIRSGMWGKGTLMFRYSEDNGATWSNDRELTDIPGGIRNPPILLRNGDLLVPISGAQPGFITTRDGGDTWTVRGYIPTGNFRAGQPSVIQRADGSLFAVLRNAPYILQSESADNGSTWTEAVPMTLRCPHAGISMCRFDNGHLALVFNDSSIKRTPLSVALSEDEGRTWRPPVALESNPGEYSYPCVMQSSDGHIHVTYSFLRKTIKHVEFNEHWIHLLSPEPAGKK
ncbi:MAG TPA: exo-alpha-sialidase [Candidatus Hydrogenedentes bacterium]|nr:exo-alpha-sialidase [Candidatus Hydrogenedentota bacterium]HOV76105.1 exo-alpha-sialidase [Candidatus Hydrogenedentota bacterium]HPC18316.1 exo-alpha-sialidase [Candidatus Hydrogenedentota bacterium]HRT22069.1 exo-alpha-sialidase [Candidatus Hydrogenedentota bacterium]HRT66813.1 exo-alpha-sialidase [Candidatus Hydrogenedentota bacterium]